MNENLEVPTCSNGHTYDWADEMAALAIAWIDTHDDARWYIDHRDARTARDVLDLIPEEEQINMIVEVVKGIEGMEGVE